MHLVLQVRKFTLCQNVLWIRIQHFKWIRVPDTDSIPDPDTDPGFWCPKKKKNTAEIFVWLLYKGRPSYRKSLHPSKD
jgi:hypothetical protein